MRAFLAAVFLVVSTASSLPAVAQTAEIRLARQFSMGYLQFNLIEKHKLLEKHAAALGIKDLKVTWAVFNGANAMNDALLSGSLDIVSGGVTGLVTLWARTRGTPQEVKGIATFTSQPIWLNTRNPAVKSIRDFTDADRIALPAIKVSINAVILHMAAAKEWGPAEYTRLDRFLVAMTPPDSSIALQAGAAGLTSAFSLPPFQYVEIEKPEIRTVLNSYEVFGGPHSFTGAWTSAAFRAKNPALYKALIGAFTEATEMLNKDVTEAAAHWVGAAKSKLSLEKVAAIARGPQVKWTMAPENMQKLAEFMHSVGAIKAKPATWKDMFFEEIHHLPGS